MDSKQALLVAVERAVRTRAKEKNPLIWSRVAVVMLALTGDAAFGGEQAKEVARNRFARLSRRHSEEQLDAIAASVDQGCYREAVEALFATGMAPGIVPAIPGVNADSPKAAAPKEEPTEPDTAADVAMRKLERAAKFYKAGYEKLVDERARWEEILEAIGDAVATVEPIQPADLPAPTILLNNRPRVLMPLFSDLHGGQKVDGEMIKGFNEFNFNVLDERLDRWCSQIEEQYQFQRAAGPVEMIDLPMLGDNIDGENIHRGQWRTIETTAMRQIFMTADRISGAVMRLARLGVPVRVKGVGGNHGRMGKKGESDFSNDFILYKYLQAKLEAQPNITFEFDWAFWMNSKHWDWRFYFCHGDNIRGWGGFPWYGTARADSNTLMMMLTQGMWYHYFIHGHFHTDMSLQTPIGKRFANGNWVGTNEYGVNGGFGGRPSQKLLVITEKGGVESEMTLYLDQINADFMNRAAASHGISWGVDPRVSA